MRYEQSVYEPSAGSDHLNRQQRYGKAGQPIPATETYRRIVSTLRHSGIRVEKWAIVNEPNHTVTFVSTYNGVAGAHYDAASNTHWISSDALRSAVEDYQYIPPDECPVAAPISRRASAEHRQRHFA